jgi:pimeloyl-ACP methyl ester carboxylesterase
MNIVRTPTLEIAYEEIGPAGGQPVILPHGWPSDPHDYDEVALALAADGCRVLLPWLRGFGPTRFRDPATPRSGQQAALGADLRDFLDGLGINHAMLVGYDWGGRAACVAAALWPERARGLVSRSTATISSTSRAPAGRGPRRKSIATGTSGTSTRSQKESKRTAHNISSRFWILALLTNRM